MVGRKVSLVVALAVAVVTSAVVSGTAGGHGASRRCAAADVRLTLGPTVVPMTGEHADLLVIAARGRLSCVADGFPRIALLHGDRRLRFRVRHGGLGYVARLRPEPVRIGDGRRGYVLVAAYRCDQHGETWTTAGRLTLPGTSHPLAVALTRMGASGIDYCRHPDTHPPNELSITPVEPTRSRAETPPS